MRTAFTILMCVAVAACGAVTSSDTAQLPLRPDGGPVMTQNEAISLAGFALTHPEYTHGNPARGARAVAAADWLAGQWQLAPSYGTYAPVSEWEWGEMRRQVRAAIGVSPQASSQMVVDDLLAAEAALEAGKSDAARQQLQPPLFSLGPDRTLAVLSNLPAFPSVSLAFDSLRREENRITGPCRGASC